MANEVIGARIPDALFIETKRDLVRRYQVAEHCFTCPEVFGLLSLMKVERPATQRY